MHKKILLSVLCGGAALVWACGSQSITGTGMTKGRGALSMQLVDAPSALDSIASVNIFVVRVDAREKIADTTAAKVNVDGDGDVEDRDRDGAHRDSSAWVTIASPNKLINIMALTGKDTAFLGAAVVDTAKFRALRLIIDPSKSTIVLKNGTILSATSTLMVSFRPEASLLGM